MEGVSVWMNRSPTIPALEVHAVLHAAEEMEPSRTPALSCAREREGLGVVLGGWVGEAAWRAALAAAAALRRYQAGSNFVSLRLASRIVAVWEWVVRKREVCLRVSFGAWLAGSSKRTVLVSAL